ncbi:sporulation histidine kinase inhibitor Sda [Virgibacillus natechei]
MESLSDKLLVEAYQQARGLNLNADFILFLRNFFYI